MKPITQRNKKIAELHIQGVLIADIAKKYNLSSTTVYVIIQAGLANKKHEEKFGNTPTAIRNLLLGARVDSLEEAMEMSIEELSSIRQIGLKLATKIKNGSYKLK